MAAILKPRQWGWSIAFTLMALLLMGRGGGAVALVSRPAPARSPKIWVYPIPVDKYKHCIHTPMCRNLKSRIESSPYYTKDPEEADFFYIPGPAPFNLVKPSEDFNEHIKEQTRSVNAFFSYIKETWPYWKRFEERGEARHILLTPCDHGPGDCSWGRPIREDTAGGVPVPPCESPYSQKRQVIFLTFNAFRDGVETLPRPSGDCVSCFQAGLDIALPTQERAVCGPLCGDLTREDVRAVSPWTRHMAEGTEPTDEELLTDFKARKHVMFYGGRIGDRNDGEYTGRGSVYVHLRKRPGYLIVNTEKNEDPKVPFLKVMPASKFCYSPRGQAGGDRDRYVISILLGCIPVMGGSTAQNRMALPFDEHPEVNWEDFSIPAATIEGIPQLGDLLEGLGDSEVIRLRRGMWRVWRRMLFTSMEPKGTYLGEDGDGDGFDTLVGILARRLQEGYVDIGTRVRMLKEGRFDTGSKAPPPKPRPPSSLPSTAALGDGGGGTEAGGRRTRGRPRGDRQPSATLKEPFSRLQSRSSEAAGERKGHLRRGGRVPRRPEAAAGDGAMPLSGSARRTQLAQRVRELGVSTPRLPRKPQERNHKRARASAGTPGLAAKPKGRRASPLHRTPPARQQHPTVTGWWTRRPRRAGAS